MTFAEIAKTLTSALALTQSPVAIALVDAPPPGVAAFSGRVPGGCRFWQEAATRTFATVPADHDLCAIGTFTHNLETGELGTYDAIRRASILAMAAGADFIKTSTGKVQPAATLPVTLVMLEAIRDFERATGRTVGMKPAGGPGRGSAGRPRAGRSRGRRRPGARRRGRSRGPASRPGCG